ncbi:hypothetical protein ACYZTM_26810 [Pseudomonas sp. MDT2-39-1]
MDLNVYANQDWQSFGTVREDGNLYADGLWNFNKDDRGRKCGANGNNSSGLYYVMNADPSCPFPSGRMGQLVMRSGNTVTGYENYFSLKAGQIFELRINDGGLNDNEGSLLLRFVPSSVSKEIKDRVNPDREPGHYWINP